MGALFGADAFEALAAGAVQGAREGGFPFWCDDEITNLSSYEEAIRKRGRQGQLTVWNTILLGGKVFPGVASREDAGACICIPTSARARYGIDRQKVQTETPAERKARVAKKGPEPPPVHRLISEGYTPGPVALKVGMWRREQYDAYRAYLPTINPRLKENLLRALPIDHPDLTDLGITSIFINDVPIPEWDSTWGLRWVEIGAHEIFDPSPKSSNVAQTIKPTKLDINNNSGVGLGDTRYEIDKSQTRGPGR